MTAEFERGGLGAGVKASLSTGTALATALCACAIPAGIAFACYEDGGYTGTTEQGAPISFRVSDERVKRLDAVAFAECGDTTRQRIVVEDGRVKIEDGRFSLELSGQRQLEVSVTGRLRETQARGKIKANVKPPGTTCSVETRWQAKAPQGASA